MPCFLVHTGECMGFYVVSMGIFHVQHGSFMPAKVMVSAGVSSRPQAGALLARLSFSAHRCHVSGLISKRAAVSAALESLDMQKPQNSKKICMQMRTAHQLNFIPQKQMFEYV